MRVVPAPARPAMPIFPSRPFRRPLKFHPGSSPSSRVRRVSPLYPAHLPTSCLHASPWQLRLHVLPDAWPRECASGMRVCVFTSPLPTLSNANHRVIITSTILYYLQSDRSSPVLSGVRMTLPCTRTPCVVCREQSSRRKSKWNAR